MRLAEGLAIAASGIDEHVDATITVDKSCDGALYLRLITDIKDERRRFSAGVPDSGHRGIRPFGNKIAYAYACATSSKCFGRRCSYPLASASDHDNLAVESIVGKGGRGHDRNPLSVGMLPVC